MVIRRGDIWWAELPEPAGSGPGFKRPLLIIQANEFNDSRIGTTIAAVITSNVRLAAAPGNVPLAVRNSKLPKKSVINVSQIVIIDKAFLTEKVHSLSAAIMDQVEEGLKIVLKIGTQLP